jgi:hypothetical protein
LGGRPGSSLGKTSEKSHTTGILESSMTWVAQDTLVQAAL